MEKVGCPVCGWAVERRSFAAHAVSQRCRTAAQRLAGFATPCPTQPPLPWAHRPSKPTPQTPQRPSWQLPVLPELPSTLMRVKAEAKTPQRDPAPPPREPPPVGSRKPQMPLYLPLGSEAPPMWPGVAPLADGGRQWLLPETPLTTDSRGSQTEAAEASDSGVQTASKELVSASSETVSAGVSESDSQTTLRVLVSASTGTERLEWSSVASETSGARTESRGTDAPATEATVDGAAQTDSGAQLATAEAGSLKRSSQSAGLCPSQPKKARPSAESEPRPVAPGKALRVLRRSGVSRILFACLSGSPSVATLQLLCKTLTKSFSFSSNFARLRVDLSKVSDDAEDDFLDDVLPTLVSLGSLKVRSSSRVLENVLWGVCTGPKDIRHLCLDVPAQTVASHYRPLEKLQSLSVYRLGWMSVDGSLERIAPRSLRRLRALGSSLHMNSRALERLEELEAVRLPDEAWAGMSGKLHRRLRRQLSRISCVSREWNDTRLPGHHPLVKWADARVAHLDSLLPLPRPMEKVHDDWLPRLHSLSLDVGQPSDKANDALCGLGQMPSLRALALRRGPGKGVPASWLNAWTGLDKLRLKRLHLELCLCKDCGDASFLRLFAPASLRSLSLAGRGEPQLSRSLSLAPFRLFFAEGSAPRLETLRVQGLPGCALLAEAPRLRDFAWACEVRLSWCSESVGLGQTLPTRAEVERRLRAAGAWRSCVQALRRAEAEIHSAKNTLAHFLSS